MFTVPVRFAVFAVVLAAIFAAAGQSVHATPLPQTESQVLCEY